MHRFRRFAASLASKRRKVVEESAAIMNDPEPTEIPGINDVDLMILNDLVSNRIAEVDVRIDSDHLSLLIALKEKILLAAVRHQRTIQMRGVQKINE
jgi:hypothetical protein